MATRVEYQIELLGTEAALTEAVTRYTIEDDTRPGYQKRGALVVTDLISADTTLDSLRTQIVATILAAA